MHEHIKKSAERIIMKFSNSTHNTGSFQPVKLAKNLPETLYAIFRKDFIVCQI